MLSAWNLSPNKRQVPFGDAPTCLIPRYSSKDAVMHVLTFLTGFISQETNEGKNNYTQQT